MVKLAQKRAEKPNAAISESCGSKAATKAAYRLLDNEDVKAEAIQAGHKTATVGRSKGEKIILAIQDTTQLDYTAHRATKGLGYLQDLKHQGMLVHTTLAVNPGRVVMGVIQQQMWIRPIEDYGKRHKRCERKIEEKESNKWLVSLEAAHELQRELPDTLVVSVGDSEADVYDLFLKAKALSQNLLVRASWNRNVEHEEKHLWERVANQPISGEITIEIPRRTGKKARKADLTVRHDLVTIKPPRSRRAEKLGNIQIWAVLICEEAPPEGEEAIEWLLLTTVAVESFEDACERISWYTCRWIIETYHKVLKSGCRVEERQFADLENLQRYLALDAIVAWRVLYLTMVGRESPDLPCTIILEIHEWQALYGFIHKTNQMPQTTPTIRQATLWIAQLGGFLGRKADGNPGPIVIWRGLHNLSYIVESWLIFHPEQNKCGYG